MRLFLVFILATIALSLDVTEANACPAGYTPCGSVCCPQ